MPTLTPAIEQEALALQNQISRANDEYYNQQAPTLSDAEYDALTRRLRGLETEHPELARGSVTAEVGANVDKSSFKKVQHMVPMLSLGNAMSEEDIAAWKATRDETVGGVGSVFAELKIDGLSLAITYKKGKLVRAATRGDGTTGEDITANAMEITDIPHTLLGDPDRIPPLVEVRGEVYLPLSQFRQLNEKLEADGAEPYKNARNAASGALRVIDANVTRERGLKFFGYYLVLPKNANPMTEGMETQEQLLDRLVSWGFPVSPLRGLCNGEPEIKAFVDNVASQRANLDFLIDGVVLKVNSMAIQEDLGIVGKREPKWAIARKWPAEVAQTKLRAIQMQVGRTGRVTPVAVVEPVQVGGVTVTNVTLHNEDYIRGMDLRIGDTVELTRAGEVIPQILGVKRGERDGSEESWNFPTACPECDTPLTREADAADTFCTNQTCPAQVVRRLGHAASRAALDIRGLGDEMAEKLVKSKLVDDWADLYDLTVEDLLSLDGVAATSAMNLLGQIAATKTKPLSRVLYAFGIKHLGKTVSDILARRYGSIQKVSETTAEELGSLAGVGPVIAQAVTEAFTKPEVKAMVQKLAQAGVAPEAPAQQVTGTNLAGKTFVVTGTMSKPRSEVEAAIKAAGGTVSGSVSGKTSFLVAGDNVGAGKTGKARDLGVAILTEAELMAMIGPVASNDTVVMKDPPKGRTL